ncbi:hypothetical protein [Flavobacterium sp.]
MEEIFFYLELLTQDMLTAFGIFSIIYLIMKIFFKNQKLIDFDIKARKFIAINGLVFIVVWTIRTFYLYFQYSGEDKIHLKELMFGKKLFEFWFQPFFWFILSQLYRLKKLSENYFFRMLSSLFLIISFNKLSMFLSSFHRDYLPSSWSISSSLGIYPSNFILENLMKLLIFFVCVIITEKIMNRKIKTTGNSRL